MASNTQALAERLDDKAVEPARTGPTLRDYLDQRKGELAKVLNSDVDAKRLARFVLTAYRQSSKMSECSYESIFAAALDCAQTHLEPGPMKQVYLIPRWNKDRKATECSFQISYRGWVELFHRAGIDVVARRIGSNDVFEYYTDEKGDHVLWKPDLRERGVIVGWFGLAQLPSGNTRVHHMTPADVERHRSYSQRPNAGPWKDEYDAMACKSVILEMEKFLPRSLEISEALERDSDIEVVAGPRTERPVIDEESDEQLAIEVSSTDAEFEDPDVAAPGEPREALL